MKSKDLRLEWLDDSEKWIGKDVEGNGCGLISGTFRHFTGGTDGSHKEFAGTGNLPKTGHKLNQYK